MAAAALESGDFASAERYLRRAADLAPENAGAHADLAVALDWVARQPGIDPARVGVHGGSQALLVSRMRLP